jgi:hypothetical protein
MRQCGCGQHHGDVIAPVELLKHALWIEGENERLRWALADLNIKLLEKDHQLAEAVATTMQNGEVSVRVVAAYKDSIGDMVHLLNQYMPFAAEEKEKAVPNPLAIRLKDRFPEVILDYEITFSKKTYVLPAVFLDRKIFVDFVAIGGKEYYRNRLLQSDGWRIFKVYMHRRIEREFEKAVRKLQQVLEAEHVGAGS